MVDEFYVRQARKIIPAGYYQLTVWDELRASDLVFDWTTNKFYRADDEIWLKSPLIDREDMICAIRKAQFEAPGFTQTRVFKLK